jgi:hypothetical protein
MNDKKFSSHQAVLIEKLIGAPLIAAASANSSMAKEQMKFLMDSCFDLKDGIFSPKMVRMTLKSFKSPKDKKPIEASTFELPLITVIPFNSLCVKDISIKFDLEIISNTNNHSHEDKKAKNKVQMRGSIASSNDNSESKSKMRNQAKMAVEITGGTIPLPIGLTTLLNLYAKNIQLKS